MKRKKNESIFFGLENDEKIASPVCQSYGIINLKIYSDDKVEDWINMIKNQILDQTGVDLRDFFNI